MNLTETQSEFPVDREQLVAYLDGELAPHQCRQIEQRLAEDDAYRTQLSELDRVWDCLDSLPAHTVDEQFTRSTIQLVRVEASQQVARARQAVSGRERIGWMLGIAACVAALSIGMLAGRRAWPDPNRQLIDQLPLIANADALLVVDSLEYLNLLHDSTWFEDPHAAELVPESEEAIDDGSRLPEAEGADSQSLYLPPGSDDAWRRWWLETRSPEAKARLANLQQRLSNLKPQRRQEIARLYDQIVAQANAEERLNTLRNYHKWVRQLTPGQQNDLLALPVDQRMQRIERHRADLETSAERRREQQQRLQQMAPLTPHDVKNLGRWFMAVAQQHREEVLQVGLRRPWEVPPLRDAVAHRRLFYFTKALHWLRSTADLDSLGLKRLQAQLSSEPARILSEAQDEEQKRRLLAGWVFTAMRVITVSKDIGEPMVGEEELEEFFSHVLSSDQREHLLSLPQDEFERKLRQLYFEHIRSGLGATDRDEAPGRDQLRQDDRRRRVAPPARRPGPPQRKAFSKPVDF